ncbi:unnamed protein product [Staurois parvus]|uniref:Uncharacterized protein n=1 Tax=Staurois parvus TaxID=386267 RepID=A0ABN9AFP3_9NEOB|nr:unnamed protein product [Staurois parvus]
MQLLGHGNPHSMKLSTHCCWAHLKATPSLEVFSYCLCRQLATSTHCALQHALTPALSCDVAYYLVAEWLLFPVASTLL